MSVRWRNRSAWLFWAFGLMAAAPLFLGGCSTTNQTRAPASEGSNDSARTRPAAEKGGAQLWNERCTQCHYARDPGTFSQHQWETIMLHMRIRANLTAAEHQKILEFFKSAN